MAVRNTPNMPKGGGATPLVSRREREIARTREDILLAAATAFASNGFDATTMNAIAHAAGYTAPSLYSYFKSKEDIVTGLFALIRSEFRGVYDAPIPSGLTFRQRLETVIRSQLELADRRRDAFTVFIAMIPRMACGALRAQSNAKASSPASTKANGRVRAKKADGRKEHVRLQHDTEFELTLQRLREWLSEHASLRDLGGHDPDDAAHALMGIQHSFFRRWLRASGGGSAGAEVTYQTVRRGNLADQTELIVDLFLGGVSSARGSAASRSARAPAALPNTATGVKVRPGKVRKR